MISIDKRPAEVASRTVPGHWEGDLVMGAMNRSALGTLVERMTRFLIIVILTEHDATSTRFAFGREIMRLPAHLRRSMTYDQGKEMSEHVQLTMDTKMQVYFAHPHSPWMRGTNENTNGLIRDFFPKGTDFSQVSERELRKVQHMLNERPRKTLGWKTPKEAMHELILQAART
jgi:IS30 family transposase